MTSKRIPNDDGRRPIKLSERLENDPTLWTKKEWARDSFGFKANPSGDTAVCWCLSSLLARFTKNYIDEAESQVRLAKAIASDHTRPANFVQCDFPAVEIINFNDEDDINVEDIIRVLKRANV